MPTVGKRLNPRGLTNREIPDASVREGNHVLATWHPVIARLQRLGGPIQQASSMAGIRPGTGPEKMIGHAISIVHILKGLGQIMNRVSDSSPRLERVRHVIEAFRGPPAIKECRRVGQNAVVLPVLTCLGLVSR
jgi:hypothetical protein